VLSNLKSKTQGFGAGTKRFWKAEAGAKNFLLVEPEPKIWVPVPQTYLGGKQVVPISHWFLVLFFYFSTDQIVLEPEPKTSTRWCWDQNI